MQVSELRALFQQHPAVLNCQKFLQSSETEFTIQGFAGSGSCLAIAEVLKQHGGLHLILLNDKEEAAYFLNSLQSALEGKDIWFFPDSFKMPLKFNLINSSNVLLRAEAISNFLIQATRFEVMVSYPEALLEKCIGKLTLQKNTLHVEINMQIDVDFILEVLLEYGFRREEFVYAPGQFAIRGGIVDIFSFAGDKPFRIELFGNEVESIRTFDPETQISQKSITSFTIVPNIQTQFETEVQENLFSILPENTHVWVQDKQFLFDRISHCIEEVVEFCSELEQHPENYPAHPFLTYTGGISAAFVTPSQIRTGIEASKSLIEFGKPQSKSTQAVFNQSEQPIFNKKFDALVENMLELQQKGYTTILTAENPKQLDRFSNIFHDINPEFAYEPVLMNLHSGIIDHTLRLAVYTDHQIFNRYHKFHIKQAGEAAKKQALRMLTELQIGDYVTHLDHGVGQFMGLQKLEFDGKMQEAVRLKYRDGDLLYVSIHSLHKISRFTSEDGKVPTIHKLGTDTWENIKKKTKKKVKDIAKELISLYAKRKAQKGHAFQTDNYLQTELEASFLYEDTPDQQTATSDVKADMESSKPMDRLICGDVGFGKTEIAIRAAFKALQDGKQVAILVPTTILAMQHERTFRQRMGDFNIRVESINRFKTSKQKKEILEDVENGKVEILVGTHAILSQGVKFKDLGLMIVDEEQKFGVAAKEKLKNIKLNVDTLTLTATPIPRTLQFSLMGARDLSVINTPPPNRQPIHTEVHTYNDTILRDAIYHEYDRGGQVFFIHNRVKDLYDVGAMVKRLCPDVHVGIAHGQLDGNQLEEEMMKFMDGTYDVLLATNIIETGLDIANANTIIINNAHQFGLSDLHQLRGRVGRSNKKAFCYLFAPSIAALPNDSRKRLQTLEQFSDLGAGFQIAMKDLDIRGAGNLLGGEQSGFIMDIGFETYNKILDEAIQELKETDFADVYADERARKQEFVRECIIESDTEFLIPDSYVSSIQERLTLYTRINTYTKLEQLKTFETELVDRFGPIPPATSELLIGVQLQWLGKQLGIERINVKQGIMICGFVSNPKSEYYQTTVFAALLAAINKQKNLMQLKHTPKALRLVIHSVSSLASAYEKLFDLLSQTKLEKQELL